MKRYLISLLIITLLCFEYKKPTESNSINGLIQSLESVNELFYSVKYHDSRFDAKSESDIYGLVHLKRNQVSGYSDAYFGCQSQFLPNHLQSYYLKNQFIGKLSSNLFTDHHIEMIIDSLHSPLLLNTENLILYENEATEVKEEYLDLVTKKTSFLMKEKKLDLIWDTTHKKIVNILYHENLADDSMYFVRSWEFQYFHKNDFMTLSSQYESQNQQILQQFL